MNFKFNNAYLTLSQIVLIFNKLANKMDEHLWKNDYKNWKLYKYKNERFKNYEYVSPH